MISSLLSQRFLKRCSVSRALSAKVESRMDPIFLSPWHDIPIRPTSDPTIFNFVCEIPMGSKPPKLEISTDLPNNPIVQDSNKDGTPRFYKLDPMFHYGAIPQTYEDPLFEDELTGVKGDGDPVDFCDISTHIATRPGEIYSVKVLGALAMIDGGEIDWKIIGIRESDPMSKQIDDIKTAPKEIIELSERIREWFKMYKVPEGKGENKFAFDGKWLDRDTALKVLDYTHTHWKDIISKPRENIWVRRG